MTAAMDLEVTIEGASLSKHRNTPPDNVLCTLSVPYQLLYLWYLKINGGSLKVTSQS